MSTSKETTYKQSLEQQLHETGERDRLRELLRQRLTEAGWHNQIRQRCREIVKEQGVDRITADELITQITPEARKLVPDEVKRELLQQIRVFMQKKTGITD